ncbi:MAG: PQQ-dependent sugar dehydrogenase [bacterium]
MSKITLVSLLFIVIAAYSCNSSPNDPDIPQLPVSLVNAFPNLHFTEPVFLCHSNDGSDRIFVIEQEGIVHIFPNDSTVAGTNIFLNIRSRVTSGGERGLLGLAFHPDYSSNGFFYVNYTTNSGGPLRTVVSRFSGQGQQADANSELILLEVTQPFSNHNGGMIAFDRDGYLVIALGDGGSGGDPRNHGQDRTTLLGSVLRIDVDNPANGLNYGIPPDNPFVGAGNGVREEIFAYGLRNPWRFSIDEQTGEMWAGDVGQNAREEIDLIEKGGNYGWRIMEGFDCFNPSSGCDQSNLKLPIVDYSHGDDCSVTGGYLYRGVRKPGLVGAYIYGDFCSGSIRMLRYHNNQLQADSLLVNSSLAISSFGVDAQNELYIIDYGGQIYLLK